MSDETLSYGEALAWLYGFSDTERTGKFTGKFSRDREDNIARMRALLSFLDDPQRTYSVTHIAGTKGKGSTAALLASILRAAGIATGLYTQPDLHTFRERIQLDGRIISEAEVARLVPIVRAATEALDPALGSLITYDVGTALAFLAFREAGMRHAVVEVGLGGRLDATNVVDPMATAITSISYDHMEVLGHTLAEIAREKAGIIKHGIPILTSARAPEALEVIARIAAERDAPLMRIGPEGATDCDYTYSVGSGEQRGADLQRARAAWRLRRHGAWPARRASDRERDARRGARRDPTRRRAAHHRGGDPAWVARWRAGRRGCRSWGARHGSWWIPRTTPTRSRVCSPRCAATSPSSG